MIEITNDTSITTSAPSQPISSGERVRLLDALRGFAVLGILLANMLLLSGFFLLPLERAEQLGSAAADRVTLLFIEFFVDGKFYSLFSFLFGLGFAVQMKRADKRGADFVPLFRRRLWILLLIGLAHAYLLWYGDILSIYAATGFLLVYFRRASDKALLRWAVALLAAPIAIYSLMVLLRLPDPFTWLLSTGGEAVYDKEIDIYTDGNYFQILKANLGGLAFRYLDLLYTSRFPKVLGMFLLGFYAGRREILSHVEDHLSLIRRVTAWGLVLGLIGNAALTALTALGSDAPPSPFGIAQTAAYAVGVPSLCLFYAGVLTLLWRKPSLRKLLLAIAPVGQMALTSYVMQTLICVTIFYGYGFGLFGQVGATKGTGLVVMIFIFQIIFSNLWLRRFQYGPLEWVWRRLTYRRRLPLRIRREAGGELQD